ncbi:phytanoyl-CoA dioxygenase family protein [Nonomuraea sp. NPDC005692]|uniref:phytanoyl-CoA dioxygenase family protein n=1 Tax=Nonomuraea sp. NPDC005692 TaxID=3157168 RepID=UPI0033FD59DD
MSPSVAVAPSMATGGRGRHSADMLTSNGYRLPSGQLGELEAVPDNELRDREALWERLRREGYLFLRGALEPDVVNAFRAYYFSVIGPAAALTDSGMVTGGGEDRAAMRRSLFREIVPGAAYHEFCSQQAIAGWYAWFLGGETFLHRRKIIRHVRPGETGIGTATQAHYDLVYLREGTDRVLSSWIPLGDCPLTRGGLTYLERSHHRVLDLERRGELRDQRRLHHRRPPPAGGGVRLPLAGRRLPGRRHGRPLGLHRPCGAGQRRPRRVRPPVDGHPLPASRPAHRPALAEPLARRGRVVVHVGQAVAGRNCSAAHRPMHRTRRSTTRTCSCAGPTRATRTRWPRFNPRDWMEGPALGSVSPGAR